MNRKILFVTLLLLQTAIAHAQVPDFAEQEKVRFQAYQQALASGQLASAASGNYKVGHYRLECQIDPAIRFIRGKVTATISLTANASSISFDLANELSVDSVVFRGARIGFSRPGDQSLVISFPTAVPANTRDSLTIFYQGVPPVAGFGSFSISSHAGVPGMWTLSQPFGAKDWWPCRAGLEDKADSIDIIVTTPEAYLAASNGMLRSNTAENGKRTVWWKHRYPVATYLVSISATNYVIQNDTIQLKDKVILPLQQFAYPESATRWSTAIPMTRDIMRFFEDLVGPYPFRNEQYAHTQVGFGGGMEHQTNSSMGALNEVLLTHELAHQWFGDKVTCASWSNIWLNEGFAVLLNMLYFDKIFTKEYMDSYYQSHINFITQANGGSVFVYDSTNANRIFDYRLSYLKGAWVLRMLQWKLGDTVFFRGLRSYLGDPALTYQFARTESLQYHLEKASGQNLSKYFKDWVYGEGYPSYQLKWLPLGASRVQVELNQVTSHPSVSFFALPVPILFRKAGKDSLVVFDHIANGQRLSFDIGFLPDTVIIDPKRKLLSTNNTIARADANASVNGVKIFPNPVGSQFSILLTRFSDPDAYVTIHNAAGQLMYRNELQLPAGNELLQIPSSGWPAGVYIVHVRSKTVDLLQKLIK